METKRKLMTLLSNLPGMAYRCSNDTHWTMEFVSDGCRKVTGYEASALVYNKDISYNDLIEPKDRSRVRMQIAESLRTGTHFELTYRIRTASGEVRWVWERGIAVPSSDEASREVIEGFITDITQMKTTERKLRERERTLRKLKERLEEDTIYLQEEIKSYRNFEEIISCSDSFRRVLVHVEKVAPTDSTVLILGETGTGKELIARALHNAGRRSDRPLLTINCAALPSELIESELFGHEKGAFTGAHQRKHGRFEAANGGTLFLDEIGELPPSIQGKLLRVLQDGEIQRIGSTGTIRVDVRVIAATNRDLHEAMSQGLFRQDLYYRLNVFPIRLPPLRERKEDIPILVGHFVKKYATKTGRPISSTSKRVIDRLCAYRWPGNIRELENIIERAVILSDGETILPGEWLPQDHGTAPSQISYLQEVEREHILKALKAATWRVGGARGAATLLGLKRTTLEARMKKLGIRRPLCDDIVAQ